MTENLRPAGSADVGAAVDRNRGVDDPVVDPVSAGTAASIETEPSSAAVLFGDRIQLARAYVASLAEAGVVRGLIGPRETGRLWSRHLINSVVAAPLLPENASVVDVGSGAGLPGIPLAIARPDCTVILVEPLLRRTVYLAEIVAELELTNVRVLRGRAEDVVSSLGSGASDGADVVTSRAVAPLAKLARWSVPLLRTGGLFLPLKGSSAAEEVARDAEAMSALGLGAATVEPVGGDDGSDPTFVVRAVLERRVPSPQTAQSKHGKKGRKKPPGRRPPANDQPSHES